MEFKTEKFTSEEGINYWGLFRKVNDKWMSVFSSPDYKKFLQHRKWIKNLYNTPSNV